MRPPASTRQGSSWPRKVATYSLFAPAPLSVDGGADSPVNVGIRFFSSVDGWVTGVMFYKMSGNTGTHVGCLWDNSRTLLAQVTFTGETGSGWQSMAFSSPVAVSANVDYWVSYLTQVGHYTADSLTVPFTVGSLNVNYPQYKYSSTPAFPSDSFSTVNYGVDIVFTDTDPGGGGSGTTDVGVASETDGAFNVKRARIRGVGATAEVDSALAAVHVRTRGVGSVAETDVVPAAVTREREWTISGPASEADTAAGLSRHRQRTLAAPEIEVDASPGVVRARTRDVGFASETDSPVGVTGRRRVRDVGVASETDAAFAVTVDSGGGYDGNHDVAVTGETDAAGVVTRARAWTLGGPASETDASAAVQRVRGRAVGVTSETDTAMAVTRARVHMLQPVVEVDAVFGVTRLRTRAVGVPAETDVVPAGVTRRRAVIVGVAAEVDSAYPVDGGTVPDGADEDVFDMGYVHQ